MREYDQEPRYVYVQAPARQSVDVSGFLAVAVFLVGALAVLWFGRPWLATLLTPEAIPPLVQPTAIVRQPAPMRQPVYNPPAQPAQPVQEPQPTPAPIEPAKEGVKVNARTLPPLPTAEPIVYQPQAPAQESVSVGGSLDIGLGGISAEGNVTVVQPVPTEAIEFKANAADPPAQEGVKVNRRSLK
jgi:hypothetical protein